nr:MAG TPA: hypothetical protein [Bacteriophage sp.]
MLLAHNKLYEVLQELGHGLPNCYHIAFYLYFYNFLFVIVRHIFSPTIGVEYSWKDYIYSLSMLYNVFEPFAISKLISVLTLQFLPILLDFLKEDSSSKRQKIFYLPVNCVIIELFISISCNLILASSAYIFNIKYCRALLLVLYSFKKFQLVRVTMINIITY